MSRHTRKDRRTADGGPRVWPWWTSWECGARVDLGLLQEDRPVPGDWVLIHVGFAMSKISEADAMDQLRMLTELGESEAAMEEVQGYGWANRRK